MTMSNLDDIPNFVNEDGIDMTDQPAPTAGTDAPHQQRAALKHEISIPIVERIAASLNCTVAEYGQIYDSEAHEQMLEAIMRIIATATAAARWGERDEILAEIATDNFPGAGLNFELGLEQVRSIITKRQNAKG